MLAAIGALGVRQNTTITTITTPCSIVHTLCIRILCIIFAIAASIMAATNRY